VIHFFYFPIVSHVLFQKSSWIKHKVKKIRVRERLKLWWLH